MNVFLAIVGDTWKQSKQQVVLIILIVLLLILALAAVIVSRPMDVVYVRNADGRVTEEQFQRLCEGLSGLEVAESLDGGMFDPNPSLRRRYASFVAAFEDSESAAAAAETLREFEVLGGAAPVTADGPDLVFPSNDLAKEASEFFSKSTDDGIRAFRTLSGDRISFSSAAVAERAMIALRESDYVRENKRLKIEADRGLGFLWTDTPPEFLYTMWKQAWVQAELLREGSLTMDDPSGQEDFKERERRLEERNVASGRLARSTEALLSMLMRVVFTCAMILFIAAAAGYFPGMLAAGAIDVVVARPTRRLQIFLGKYFGGMVLFAAIVFGVSTLLFVGFGLRVGYWPARIYLGASFLVFAGGVLYALLALLGVLSRSSTLALIVGLGFYIVIDTALGIFIGLEQVGMFKNYDWLTSLARGVRWSFPNFESLKGTSVASILAMPYIDWQPIQTASAWLLGSLGLGYWRFRRADY
ncbi:MAG: ABC transporter permease [Planctomycetota bacterium]